MFESDSKANSAEVKIAKLNEERATLENQIEEIRANKLYENAFEWRFEFPEVLDDKGDYIGFDAVIGNPPYNANGVGKGGGVLWKDFVSNSFDILNNEGFLSIPTNIAPSLIVKSRGSLLK